MKEMLGVDEGQEMVVVAVRIRKQLDAREVASYRTHASEQEPEDQAAVLMLTLDLLRGKLVLKRSRCTGE